MNLKDIRSNPVIMAHLRWDLDKEKLLKQRETFDKEDAGFYFCIYVLNGRACLALLHYYPDGKADQEPIASFPEDMEDMIHAAIREAGGEVGQGGFSGKYYPINKPIEDVLRLGLYVAGARGAEQDKELAPFLTLTEAYDLLVLTDLKLRELSGKIDTDFKEKRELYYFDYLCNPIKFQTKEYFKKLIEDAQERFTNFIIAKMNDKYRNFKIDATEIMDFVKKQGKFDALQVISYIKERYADEDAESLKQIKQSCRDLLTYRVNNKWYPVRKPEDIPMIGASGIELIIGGHADEEIHKVSALVKLVDIVLRETKPSQAKGPEPELKLQQTYRDDKINSLRYYKNRSLRVLFHNAEDAEKVKSALVSVQEV